MGDDLLASLAIIIYLLGVPVSFGVSVKITEAPAALFIAPAWPVVGLAYLGYRLAP